MSRQSGFCKTCDICTGGIPTSIWAVLRFLILSFFTFGIYTLIYLLRSNCPTCGHKMIYHRGQSTYWQKKPRKR